MERANSGKMMTWSKENTNSSELRWRLTWEIAACTSGRLKWEGGEPRGRGHGSGSREHRIHKGRSDCCFDEWSKWFVSLLADLEKAAAQWNSTVKWRCRTTRTCNTKKHSSRRGATKNKNVKRSNICCTRTCNAGEGKRAIRNSCGGARGRK